MAEDAGRSSHGPDEARLLPIRVLMVSTSFPETRQDWPGRFIANMAEALARREDVRLALWAPPGEHSRSNDPATAPDEAKR